jgi:hypothetical protein
MALVSLQRTLFGFAAVGPAPSRAKWKVWRGSTTKTPKFQPLDRREAWRWYREAERIERETRQPGHQDGIIGRNGLAVFRALLGLVNFDTGALVPAVATIARSGCISMRSAFRGLKALAKAGLVTWTKRAIRRFLADGSFLMEQDTSAYAIPPPTQWRVPARTPAKPSAPEPGTWGDHVPLEVDDEGETVIVRPWERPADCGLAAAIAKFMTKKPKSPDIHESASVAQRLNLKGLFEEESSATAVPTAPNSA